MSISTHAERETTKIVLRAGVPRVHHVIDEVSVDVVQAAILVAENTPDPRQECVERAMMDMSAGRLDSRVLAQAMITTFMADSQL